MGKRIKKFMIVGLLGAVITLAAELLQGFAESASSENALDEIFSTVVNLSSWRIGLGSTLGAIGILMQFFGVYAIYLSFEDKNSISAKLYRVGAYNFSIVGAIVHVLMSVMLYVYKISYGSEALNTVLDYTVWFALPIVVIFFALYILFSVVAFLQFWNKRTPFPKYFAFLNPLIGKAVINAISELLPNGALSNGLGYANMGLTSIVLFSFLLFYCVKKLNTDRVKY